MTTYENKARSARMTVTVGPLDEKDHEQSHRAGAIREYLEKGVAPDGSNHLIAARTILDIAFEPALAGESNIVRVRYINIRGDNAGFVSLFRDGFEYAVQWAAQDGYQREIEEIIESFRFEAVPTSP